MFANDVGCIQDMDSSVVWVLRVLRRCDPRDSVRMCVERRRDVLIIVGNTVQPMLLLDPLLDS